MHLHFDCYLNSSLPAFDRTSTTFCMISANETSKGIWHRHLPISIQRMATKPHLLALIPKRGPTKVMKTTLFSFLFWHRQTMLYLFPSLGRLPWRTSTGPSAEMNSSSWLSAPAATWGPGGLGAGENSNLTWHTRKQTDMYSLYRPYPCCCFRIDHVLIISLGGPKSCLNMTSDMPAFEKCHCWHAARWGCHTSCPQRTYLWE